MAVQYYPQVKEFRCARCMSPPRIQISIRDDRECKCARGMVPDFREFDPEKKQFVVIAKHAVGSEQ